MSCDTSNNHPANSAPLPAVFAGAAGTAAHASCLALSVGKFNQAVCSD